MEAYLDIETTGLSPYRDMVTVVGLCLGEADSVIQFVGRDIDPGRILDALAPATVIYTYNGSRFDLPFLKLRLGLDLLRHFAHRDLMFDCWERNLYGGLKAVERRLSLPRKLVGIGGYEAVRLWYRYERRRDPEALRLLLEYNKEDVLNLRALRDALERIP